jgi:hypothetical protein
MLIMAIIGTLTPTLFYQTYAPVCNNKLFFIDFLKKKLKKFMSSLEK